MECAMSDTNGKNAEGRRENAFTCSLFNCCFFVQYEKYKHIDAAALFVHLSLRRI
jgi:hypothetical protein